MIPTFLVGAIPGGGCDSKELISASIILYNHRGAPPFEHAWGHVPVSCVAFRICEFTLVFQKIGNFLARLFADILPCLVNATLFDRG